jgi:hypothetical protein
MLSNSFRRRVGLLSKLAAGQRENGARGAGTAILMVVLRSL